MTIFLDKTLENYCNSDINPIFTIVFCSLVGHVLEFPTKNWYIITMYFSTCNSINFNVIAAKSCYSCLHLILCCFTFIHKQLHKAPIWCIHVYMHKVAKLIFLNEICFLGVNVKQHISCRHWVSRFQRAGSTVLSTSSNCAFAPVFGKILLEVCRNIKEHPQMFQIQ